MHKQAGIKHYAVMVIRISFPAKAGEQCVLYSVIDRTCRRFNLSNGGCATYNKAPDVTEWRITRNHLQGILLEDKLFQSKQLAWPNTVLVSVTYGYRTIIGSYI